MDWSCTTLHSHNSVRVQWMPVFSTNLKSSNLLLFGILRQDLRKFAPNDRNWLISKVILLYASLIELISRNFSKMLQKKNVRQKFLNIHTVSSVEKYYKTWSRFLRKNQHFFCQINTKMKHFPIYYIKLLWKNANSNFFANLRKDFIQHSIEEGMG